MEKCFEIFKELGVECYRTSKALVVKLDTGFSLEIIPYYRKQLLTNSYVKYDNKIKMDLREIIKSNSSYLGTATNTKSLDANTVIRIAKLSIY